MGEGTAVEKRKQLPPKNIRDAFYNLASYHQTGRNAATLKLLSGIQETTNVLPYCLDRLVKGLSSPRENARLGFAVALTEVMKSSVKISCDEIFSLIDKHLAAKGDQEKNNAIGQILCLTALIRSKKCVKALDKIVERLNNIIVGRPFLEMAWAQAIVLISLQGDDESFRNIIWPAVKSHCNKNFETCTPLALWIILELDKLHQEYVRKKAKIFRQGSWPPIDEKQWKRLGEILAAGVQAVPSGVHPLEKSVLAAIMVGDRFEEFWNQTVCGYLLNQVDKRVSAIGIRMIGNALSMQPSKKQLEIILSSETLEFLLKALLDRRQAGRLAKITAYAQLDAILDYVTTNKANATIQFLVLKRILDVSLNFDGVSGSNLVHRILAGFSAEAATLATDDLISRLRSLRAAKIDGKEHLTMSESMIIIKLLHRLFELSKSTADYRLKILRLLIDAAFAKSEDLPQSRYIGPSAELTRNILMRCLDDLCVTSTSRLPSRPKFEFPPESISIMGELIDTLIDRKQRRLSDQCKISLKADLVALVVKAAKTFHQLASKNEKTEGNKGFTVLIGYVLFWFMGEPEVYAQSLEDLLTCYEKSQAEMTKSGPQWTDVLIDILLGILSRPHRHFRTPIQIAFHYFCPVLSLDNVQPLLKALKPSETENFIVEGEDDDEENEGVEDAADVAVNGGDSAEPFSSSGEESEPEENDVNVDPDFRRAIEDALGDAAAHSDTESTASDLSDEAMLKLDESLAAVFRTHLSGSAAKKSARDLAEQAQAFRVRCFDLLFVLLHSQPTADVLVGVLVSVLHVANEAVRISDQKNVFNRSRQLIDRIVQIKALPPIPEKDAKAISSKLVQSIKGVIDFTKTVCTNPSVHLLASDSIRFLLKFGGGITSSEESGTFEMEVKETFTRHLEEYLKDRQCLIPTCVFTAAFQKKPQYFLENLPMLVDAVFSDVVRPFRRREACSLILCLLHKDALTNVKDISDKEATSAWKRFISQLHKGILETIAKQKIENDDDEEKSSKAKAADFFEVLVVLRSLANLREVVPLKKLRDAPFVEELEKFCKASTIGQATRRLGQAPKWVKGSTLCSEIVKKLRPEPDGIPENCNGQPALDNGPHTKLGESQENDEENSSPSKKRKKTKD